MFATKLVSAQDEDATTFWLGALRVEPATGSIRGPGGEVSVDRKAMAVLSELAREPGKPVGREQLLASVWPDQCVTEEVLTQNIYVLRGHMAEAGGDSSYRQLIKTLPKRGYALDCRATKAGRLVPTGLARRFDFRDWQPPHMLSLLLLALLATIVFPSLRPTELASRSSIELSDVDRNPLIAVLPLSDLSPDGRHGFIAQGVAEELRGTLARLPKLRVIGTNSTEKLAQTPGSASALAKESGIDYLLEGSVRKWDERLRISLQLIDVRSEENRWSYSYDCDLDDLLALQTGIADSVAQILRISLDGDEFEGYEVPPDPAAYHEFLQGRFFFVRRSPGDLDLAKKHFAAAIAIDPQFGRAWAALAGVYDIQINTGTGDLRSVLEALEHAATRALQTAPERPESHLRMAAYHKLQRDAERWLQHMQQAKALGPDNLLVLSWAASAALLRGDYDEALELQTRVARRDPLSAVTHFNTANFLLATGDLDRSRRHFVLAARLQGAETADIAVDLITLDILAGRYGAALRAAEQLPSSPERHRALALAHSALGNEGLAKVSSAQLHSRSSPRAAIMLAEYHVYRGELERAFEVLETVPALSSVSADAEPLWPPLQLDLRVSPFFLPIRVDPRFESIVRSIEATTASQRMAGVVSNKGRL